MRKLRAFSKAVCDSYGVPQARVIAKDEPGCWATYDWNGLICLNPAGGRNAITLAHELAHHVNWCQGYQFPYHGPRFMRVYIQILDNMRLIPAAGMRSIARKYGVKIAR